MGDVLVPPPVPSSSSSSTTTASSSSSDIGDVHVRAALGAAVRAARVVAAGPAEAIAALLAPDTTATTTTATTTTCTAPTPTATAPPARAATIASATTTPTAAVRCVALVDHVSDAVPAGRIPARGEAGCAEGAIGPVAGPAAEARAPGITPLVRRGKGLVRKG